MRNPSFALLLAAILVPAAVASCSDDDSPDKPDASTGGRTNTGGSKSTGGADTLPPGGSSGKDGGTGGAAPEKDGGHSGGGSGGADTDGGDASVNPGTGGEDAGSTGGAPTKDGGQPDGTVGCVFPRCQPPYPEVIYPEENPQSDAKAMLGKILFWDQQIGQLNSMACGSCHRSNSGGSLPAVAQKHLPGPDNVLDTNPGITSDDIMGALGTPVCDANGTITNATRQATTRKPPTYLDAMFAGQIFWDGRAGYCKNGEAKAGCFYDPDLPANAAPIIMGKAVAGSTFTPGGALEAQAAGPPVNSTEMACAGQNWTKIGDKLKTLSSPLKFATAVPADMKAFITANGSSYPAMFQTAFGSTAKIKPTDPDNVINTRRIVFAIATHERRLTSNQTPYDRWVAGDDSAMTAAQISGFTNFVGKARCSFCHAPPLFTDNSFHNIGFHKPAWDAGRKAITSAAGDNAAFKTPTLRNVGLREAQGLLHNGTGSGKDLDIVMQLYKQGGLRNDTDIAPFIDPGLVPVTLTTLEITEIVDFMRNALTDPRVQKQCPPFDRPAIDGESAVQGPCP